MAAGTHPLESRRSRIGRWTGAALLVCALHVVGGALLVMDQPDDEAWDDPAGGVNVDMVAPPAPTSVQSQDLAHGPERTRGWEVAEAAKQAVQKVEKDLPLVEPSPAPNPEIVLPKETLEEKEQPKEETRDAVKKQTAKEDGEEISAAPPRIEAQPAPASAKSDGQSASISLAKANWMKGILSELQRHKRIPEAARKHRGHWELAVVFTVDRAGKVLGVQIKQSSGSPVLDAEASALLGRVAFPPAPDQLPGETFEYKLPLKFTVK